MKTQTYKTLKADSKAVKSVLIDNGIKVIRCTHAGKYELFVTVSPEDAEKAQKVLFGIDLRHIYDLSLLKAQVYSDGAQFNSLVIAY